MTAMSSRFGACWRRGDPLASIGRLSGRFRLGSAISRCRVRSAPKLADVIGLNYTDTDGKTKYCYNSAIASCRIRLSGPDSLELTATRRAMFEILTDTRHADVPLLA